MDRYNVRNRTGVFLGTVSYDCECGYLFGVSYDFSTDVVFLVRDGLQVVQGECPRCGRLCWASPRRF